MKTFQLQISKVQLLTCYFRRYFRHMRRESASNQLIWFLSHLKKKLISEKITSRRKFIHDFVKAEAERDTW